MIVYLFSNRYIFDMAYVSFQSMYQMTEMINYEQKINTEMSCTLLDDVAI